MSREQRVCNSNNNPKASLHGTKSWSRFTVCIALKLSLPPWQLVHRGSLHGRLLLDNLGVKFSFHFNIKPRLNNDRHASTVSYRNELIAGLYLSGGNSLATLRTKNTPSFMVKAFSCGKSKDRIHGKTKACS